MTPTPNLRVATEADSARVEYEAVTAKGVPIRTFDDRKAAVKWLTEIDGAGQSNLARYPKATVREVIYPAPIKKTVWRERNLRLVESV